jgi:NAD+ kinase
VNVPHIACVGVVAHPSKPVASSVTDVVSWAARTRVNVVVRAADAAQVGPSVSPVSDDEFTDQVDAIISLGGDGTMLGAMRLSVGRPVPVLGVNYGNVGFLVEIPPRGLPTALDRLAGGQFDIEPHSCVEVDDGHATAVAFNDVVVAGADAGIAVELDLTVEGVRFGYYRCDALILATPTGSTAYNYAAGGPVVSPGADVLALTPVAPMTGVSRSIVLPAHDTVTIHNAPDSSGATVRIDGIPWSTLASDTAVTARLRPEAAHVVRLDPRRHAQRSRVKLSLLDLPLRPEQMRDLLPTDMREEMTRLRERRTDTKPSDT